MRPMRNEPYESFNYWNSLQPESMRLKRSTPESIKARISGFTILELMAAMVILTIAMSVAFNAFSGTIRGWRRGTEVLEGIKHGDYAMTQLTSALTSTMYFNNPRKSYAFKLERDTIAGLPADTISFVTASTAFMPENSPLRRGPHRLELFIDYDEEGHPALFSLAFPAIADLEETQDEFGTEPHLVSRAVQGLEVLLFNQDTQDWAADEWENQNGIPTQVMLTIYVPSEEENEEPITFTRVVEIPVSQSVQSNLRGPTTAITKIPE